MRLTSVCAGALLCASLGVTAAHAAPTEDPVEAGITVNRVEGLPEDFVFGVDASSMLSLEESVSLTRMVKRHLFSRF